MSKLENSVINIKNKIKNIEADTHCSSCSQEIPSHIRESAITKLLPDLDSNIKKFEEYTNIRAKMEVKINALLGSVDKLNNITTDSKIIAASIKSINLQLSTLNSSSISFDAINSLQENIIKYVDIISSLTKEVAIIGEELRYYSVVSSMLKDSGIKSTIVANYIPVINKLVNQYLEDFGLFVGFELSPTFEETIKSRHRDTYTYNSFSEGEKSAIDCALLFTFRHISSMKSTMSCNLLFLDEVGGSSLDLDNMAVLVESVGKTASNIFMITHREVEEEVFDRVWEFERPGNFTDMKERLN